MSSIHFTNVYNNNFAKIRQNKKYIKSIYTVLLTIRIGYGIIECHDEESERTLQLH